MLVRFIKAFGAEFLFPPCKDESENDSDCPVGDGVGDIRLRAAVVKSGENIRFGEHIHHFYGEDERKELDRFQIVGEESRKGDDESLGQDDP